VGGLQATRQNSYYVFFNEELLRIAFRSLEFGSGDLQGCICNIFRGQLLGGQARQFLPALSRKVRQDLVHSHVAQNARQRRIRLLRITFFLEQGALHRLLHQIHEVAGSRSATQSDAISITAARKSAVEFAVSLRQSSSGDEISTVSPAAAGSAGSFSVS